MNHDVSDPPTVAAAVRDAHRAAAEFDDARNWLEARRKSMPPLCAEAWVFDRECRHVLLVQHRWRGWVPPGGKVEPGEAPREAAKRELWEETGVKVRLGLAPAAVCVRSYRADWSATLGLSYSAITDADLSLTGEVGQPAAWIPLHEEWRSVFPEDRDRIRCHAQHLARSQSAAAP